MSEHTPKMCGNCVNYRHVTVSGMVGECRWEPEGDHSPWWLTKDWHHVCADDDCNCDAWEYKP